MRWYCYQPSACTFYLVFNYYYYYYYATLTELSSVSLKYHTKITRRFGTVFVFRHERRQKSTPFGALHKQNHRYPYYPRRAAEVFHQTSWRHIQTQPSRRQRYIKEPLRFLPPNISAIPFIPSGPPQHRLSSLTHLVLPVFVFLPLTVHLQVHITHVHWQSSAVFLTLWAAERCHSEKQIWPVGKQHRGYAGPCHTARCVHRLQMEETAGRCGGYP